MRVLMLFVCACSMLAQDPPSLRGVITDPSGALVPGAMVQLRGPGGEQRRVSGPDGRYSFPVLRPGRYNVRYIARGFSVTEKRAIEINGPLVLDMQLSIGTEAQVIN